MIDRKRISSKREYELRRYNQRRQVEAVCCNHEKKDAESQMNKRLEEEAAVAAGKTSFECLPHDMLLNIFSRLPSMSILQARCTCKCWHKLMTDPEFAEIHLTRAIRSPGHLYIFNADIDIYYAEKTEAIKTFQYLGNDFLTGHISSGGLMACASIEEYCFVICNPITGEQVKVKRGLAYSWNLSWGFGYSSSTKEYKIVSFGMSLSVDERIVKGEINTLGSESWRQIPHVPLPPLDQQVDCDGALFWLIHPQFYTGGPETVMSFNVGSETFQAWRGPHLEVIPKPELKLSCLAKFGDTVAYVMNLQPNFNIWILRDKMNDIWVNDYKIVPGSPFRSLELNFVGIWKNLFLFVGEDRKSTCAYDAEKEEFEMIQLPFWNYFEKLWRSNRFSHNITRCCISHVGSFISPRIAANAHR